MNDLVRGCERDVEVLGANEEFRDLGGEAMFSGKVVSIEEIWSSADDIDGARVVWALESSLGRRVVRYDVGSV